jgi:glutathione synthase/RimK-type ligase-like ATP-grasp enzyme
VVILLTYKIYEVNSYEAIWELPPNLTDEQNLIENRFVALKCGCLAVWAKVKKDLPAGRDEQSMGLSKTVLDALKITEGWSLGVRCVSKGQFRLGPIIGLLTPLRVMAKGDFKYYTPYARKMNGKGLLFVFGAGDIDRKRKTITGYLYNNNNKTWDLGEFPYPDAVIDRTYPNNYEAHRLLEKVIGQNKIFNKKNLINKLDFFNALDKDSFLRSFIPKTKLFLETSELEHFLKKYGRVFLKPLNGMQGRGIVYVIPEKNGLRCLYMNGKNLVSKKITHPESILNVLEQAGKGKRPYVIQAGVRRMEYRKRPFNFRVMVTKDSLGNWSVPAVFARAAKPGGFLTNNSAGANFILLKNLFQHIGDKLPNSKDQLLDMVADLSIKAATALDKEYGPLGMLGLDIILDPAGKPWLIEANGNPGLMTLDTLAEYPAWRNQMYDYPIAYALHLAGFFL